MSDVIQGLARARTTSRGKTILIVENDSAHGALLMEAITLETPHHALLAIDSIRALEVIEHIKPDLFLLDYYISPLHALDLYDLLHARTGCENIPGIILSASTPQLAPEIVARHLIGLSKPVELEELLSSIERALQHPLGPCETGEAGN